MKIKIEFVFHMIISFLRSDILEAVLVQLPPVDLTILVDIDFVEELLEVLLNHLLIEEFVGF